MNVQENHAVECREENSGMKESVCPSLILDKKVVCDAGKELFQPSSRMVRESCTNEQFLFCPLRCAAS